MQPRIFRITLHVGDLDRASADYQTLLGVAGRSVGGGRAYFDCGGVILALLAPGAAIEPIPDPLYLALASAEVVATHARARELGWLDPGEVHGAPAADLVRRPWGERSFYARDPWGNRLCFVDDSTVFAGR